jgi:selenocysteine-specific elongation factor
MTTRNFIVATAGHVDHGKSALVKALTGIDPDRLPEEKARGITIDLGFAHLELPSTTNPQSSILHLGIVDVPGHEDFVKNMVAGVGSIDLALFVVAADDGWMPQTEEHLQILSYLGITRAVVALTKIDLAQDETTAIARVREKLAASPFAEAPIVSTSVVVERGLNELKMALTRVLSDTPPPRDIGKPRLPVDRVFTLRGIGTVVTGTLTGGEFRRGQSVVIQPAGKTARIRSVQNHNRDVEISRPGARTALNLPDVEGSGSGPGIQRGDVITLGELGGPSETLDVLLEKSDRLASLKTAAARPLKDGAHVRVHLGSANVPARVLLLEVGQLATGERTLAELRLELPIFAFGGDRFILRDWSEQTTLAGGTVLDPDPPHGKFRTEPRHAFLEARAQSPGDVTTFVSSQVARSHAVRCPGLLVKSRFSSMEISDALTRLSAGKRVALAGDWGMDATWWEQLCQSAMNAIDAEHRAHPERSGLPLTELRASLEKELPSPEVFEVLTADLYRSGFTQAGAAIRRTTHRPALPPHLQAAGAKVHAALSVRPFDPPSRKELAPDAASQQALRFLLQTGEAVDLSEEVILLTDSFARATEAVTTFLREHGSATAGELRQVLGTNRRIVIPLLERLDKEGVTRRNGDKRLLRERLIG